MKFKKGDKVRIKNCPEIKRWVRVLEIDVIGKIGTITSNHKPYIIDYNKYRINFTEDMLEPVNQNLMDLLK